MRLLDRLIVAACICGVHVSGATSADLVVHMNDGRSYSLNVGQSVDVQTPDCDCSCFSWEINNPSAAMKVLMLDKDGYNGRYENMFMYCDRIIPGGIYGTPQYCGHNVRINCITNSPPQPSAFIPIDRMDLNSEANQPISPVPTHRMLLMRRAFFWENSEQLGGIHGPYGDIKINVCPATLAALGFEYLQYRWDEIIADPLFHRNSFTLPGPAWGADDNPPPANEWLDGPWGCKYSNIYIYDWDDPNQAFYNYDVVSIVVAEADVWPNPEDFLDVVEVHRGTDGIIRMDVSMFGWVELQNVDVSGPEPVISNANQYWFPSWNGLYPADILGQHAFDQYRPLPGKSPTEMESNFAAGSTIGIIGGTFPLGNFAKPMKYVAACVPAVSGGDALSGVRLFEHPNFAGDSRFFGSDVSNLDVGTINFADVASSIQISDIAQLILFDGQNFTGAQISITLDVSDLTLLGWNDRVGSLKIIR